MLEGEVSKIDERGIEKFGALDSSEIVATKRSLSQEVQ